jgi:hypothetical protein
LGKLAGRPEYNAQWGVKRARSAECGARNKTLFVLVLVLVIVIVIDFMVRPVKNPHE